MNIILIMNRLELLNISSFIIPVQHQFPLQDKNSSHWIIKKKNIVNILLIVSSHVQGLSPFLDKKSKQKQQGLNTSFTHNILQRYQNPLEENENFVSVCCLLFYLKNNHFNIFIKKIIQNDYFFQRKNYPHMPFNLCPAPCLSQNTN